MAAVQSIAKAKATGLVLKNVFGIEPQYQYLEDHVRVYFKPEDLPTVHAKINELFVKGKTPSDVRIDYLPVISPIAIKKVLPIAIGTLVTGYLLGKLL